MDFREKYLKRAEKEFAKSVEKRKEKEGKKHKEIDVLKSLIEEAEEVMKEYVEGSDEFVKAESDLKVFQKALIKLEEK